MKQAIRHGVIFTLCAILVLIPALGTVLCIYLTFQGDYAAVLGALAGIGILCTECLLFIDAD